MSKKRSQFTGKQRAFIDSYLRCLNATQAAKDAEYGGSYDTLRAIGAENLAKPHIRAEIDRRMNEAGITDDEILFRLKEQATADFSDAIETDIHGYVGVSVRKLIQAGKGHLIKEYKIGKDGITLKFHDSQAALVHLAKLKGLYGDKPIEINVNIDSPREKLLRRLDTGIARIGTGAGDQLPN